MKKIGSVLLAAGIVFSLAFLHAQTSLVGSFNGVATPIQTAAPDSIVQVTAEAQGLTPIAPEDLPFGGTFWWVLPGGAYVPMPCPPQDYSTAPMYQIAGNQYLVDESGGAVVVNRRRLGASAQASTAAVESALESQATALVNLIAQIQTQAANQQVPAALRAMGMSEDGVPLPGDGGDDGGGTNTFTSNGSGFSVPDYGTNLWIAQWSRASGYVTGMAMNTKPGVAYEILTNVDIKTTNWGSTGLFIYGSETTNWTPLPLMAVSLTNNCFFRLKSWVSSDGSGLPDWWELEYFGTTGIDPNADPMGDGWSNIQKFQNGMDPTVFYPPAAPQGLNAAWNSGNGDVALTWLPASGPVTNYLVTKYDYQTDTSTTFNVSATSTSLADNLADDPALITTDYLASYGPEIGVNYAVVAQYAGGNSAEADVLLGLQSPPAVGVARGPQGNLNLIVSGLPQDVTAIKVFRAQDGYSGYLGGEIYAGSYAPTPDPLTNGYFEISASGITNGIFLIPTNQVSPFGSYHFWVQGERANGTTTEWSADYAGDWAAYNGPFVDARQQLKDNLRFLLRAASQASPFQFMSWYGNDNSLYRWPTNYVHASLFNDGFAGDNNSYYWPLKFDEALPIVENYELRNFAYDPNLIGSGGELTDGVYHYYDFSPGVNLFLSNSPTIFFDTGTLLDIPLTVPPSVLSSNQTQWIVPLSYGLVNYPMTAGQHNLYGLPYLSVNEVNFTNSQVYSTIYSPVSAFWTTNQLAYYETAQPVFQTAGYYFAQPNVNPMPEQAGFATTNTNPLLIQGVGSSQQIAGYAKLGVQNGNSGVYAYLGQYFDKAYEIDANGNTTTNTTGILSPYGEFYATEPGPVALVTMPDLDTGERGTGTVYCVSLNVDANHDGTMDLTFNGPDATSQASPMVAWINNGYIKPGSNGNLDEELPLPLNNLNYANCFAGKVTCQRDLENFFRLWICGVPSLPVSQNYTYTLSMTPIVGNPAVNLYWSCETNGGIGYLTDTNIAAQQANTVSPYNFGTSIGTVSGSQSCSLANVAFAFGGTQHLLIEGVAGGEGQLTFSITDSHSNMVVQTSVWLELHDVEDLYEQARATNVTSGLPPSSLVSQYTLIHPSSGLRDESKQVIVHVHGMNVSKTQWKVERDTIFKRLYWSGYHGRFASFKWPCAYLPFENSINPFNYNLSEFYAWKSAAAFKDYLCYLTNRTDLAGYSVSILAHSQGNIVASEAIKQGAPFDNYILTQAAVPAHCYDTNVPFLATLLTADTDTHTPFYTSNGGYHGYFANLNAHGRLIDFFNTNDFALESGTYTIPVIGITLQANWVADQATQKPEDFSWRFGQYYTYSSLGGGSEAYYDFSQYAVTDPYEIMSMVARSRSKAVGAQDGLGGAIGSSVDLLTSFGFGKTREEHSAQILRPIQTSLDYYLQILLEINPL